VSAGGGGVTVPKHTTAACCRVRIPLLNGLQGIQLALLCLRILGQLGSNSLRKGWRGA
jgi:hypothetical protein